MRLTAALLLLFVGLASAKQNPTLVSVSAGWQILPDTHIGSKTRVEAHSQNPYPFCFSFAAATLFDQTRCIADGLANCQDQPRSSALAITPAGQRLKSQQIDFEKGGISVFSLNDIVTNGFVPHLSCNYDQSAKSELITSAQSAFYLTYQQWQKYENWTPYLTTYYQHFFTQHAKTLNPSLSSVNALEILQAKHTTHQEVMGAILLNNSCVKRITDNRFVVKQTFVGNSEKFDPKLSHAIIQQNLANNTPVLVDFCVFEGKDNYGQCVSDARHAAVIVAQAQAQHLATGDLRTVYWLVNTWGEQWQQANTDGWVFADRLLQGVYGYILWLQPAKIYN